jgi:hypothetical protein
MRAISMWSDHAAPVQGRWWKTRSRRRARSSTGLKILLAAGVVVTGVIGISGVYPHVIDAQWAQGARTTASRMPTLDAKTTAPDAKIARQSDIPASTQPPARSTALTRAEAPVAPPSRAAAVSTPRPTAVASPPPTAPASKPMPMEPEPPALAENPDASANADAPSTPAPTVAAKPVAPVVKRRIVSRAAPRRGGFTIGPFAFGGSPFRM